jgi:hypothetical protein
MSDKFDYDDSFSDSNNYGRADELASAWLDDHVPLDEGDISPQERERLADLSFLDALLERVHAPQPRTNEQRIARLMAAIDDQEPAMAPLARPGSLVARLSTTSRWVFSSFSAAAVILVLLTWYWTASPTRAAYAAVQRAYLDAVRLQDRQYRVTTEVRISSNHTMSIESHLTVRGGERFTLRHPVLLGQCWIGSNGRQAWYVPAVGVPRTQGDPVIAMEWARKQGVNLPDMHVSALISFLEEHFELQMLPSETLPDEGTILWQRVRGIRKAGEPGHLQLVELWAHPKSGIARKIVLKWNRKPQDLGVTQITLDLVGEQPMPDSWYEAASHQPLPVLPISPIVPLIQP